jgi:hypothetical protein
MTIFHTAYDTTICSGTQSSVERIKNAIAEARIRDYLPSADDVVQVYSTRGAQAAIPAFNHPLYILNKDVSHGDGGANNAMLAVDLRPAVKADDGKSSAGLDVSGSGEYRVTNATVYRARLYRAALNAVWLKEGPGSVRSLTPMAMSVFASWISETLSRRYALDPKTQYNLMILAGIFYSSNHFEGLEYEHTQENRVLAGIATALRVELPDVLTAYDNVKLILSIEDFCKKAKDYLNNVRLEELNAGILVALMKGTWAGDNAAENVAVALEHPPTWLAILLEAYTNRMIKFTTIAKICERRHFKDGLEMLVRAVKALAPETSEASANLR